MKFDKLEKFSFPWKDALRYTISFMFVNVLEIYLYLTLEIFSHQQSPGVVYRRFFVTMFKIKENDYTPGEYLLNFFSLHEKVQVIGDS